MRKPSRRSFTVEVKSGSRRGSTIIPSRVAAVVAPDPWPNFAPHADASALAAEPRRILPNLIVPEVPQVEPGPATATEELPPRRGRGRPRKVPVEPVRPAAEYVAEAAAEPPPAMQEPEDHPPSARAPRRRAAGPAVALALGERWKRRLGRWSR